MSREDAETVLQHRKNGTFLIRQSVNPSRRGELSLSVKSVLLPVQIISFKLCILVYKALHHVLWTRFACQFPLFLTFLPCVPLLVAIWSYPEQLTVSRVRAANFVRRPCSDSSHVTAPYKLSFYYYYYYYYYSSLIAGDRLLTDKRSHSPTSRFPSSQHQWSLLNGFRTGQGLCGTCRNKLGLTDNIRGKGITLI